MQSLSSSPHSLSSRASKKGANKQSKSKVWIHAQHKHADRNRQISDSFLGRCPLRSMSEIWVLGRPDLKRHHSVEATQPKNLNQPAFQEKIHNRLLLPSHFCFRATPERPGWLLIQVWHTGRKSDEWRTIDALFTILPWFTCIRGGSQWGGKIRSFSKMSENNSASVFRRKNESVSSSTQNYPNVAVGER